MNLSILPGRYSICRLSVDQPIPRWLDTKSFWSVSKTQDELSVIGLETCVPADVKAESGWRIMKVEGPLDFGLTGVLSSISKPLALAQISIFVVSTFDTDYVMVKDEKLEYAKHTLSRSGFTFKD